MRENSRQVDFLSEHRTGDGNSIRWIGFVASSIISGERTEFLWWRNSSDSVDKLQVFCGRLLAEHQIEAQIGPAIDLDGSSQKDGIKVIVDESKPIHGVYIEEKHRLGFNFRHGFLMRS